MQEEVQPREIQQCVDYESAIVQRGAVVAAVLRGREGEYECGSHFNIDNGGDVDTLMVGKMISNEYAPMPCRHGITSLCLVVVLHMCLSTLTLRLIRVLY